MAQWHTYQKRIGGQLYWYAQRSRTGMSPETRYIGPVNPKRRRKGLLESLGEWLRAQNELGPDDIGYRAMEEAYAQKVSEQAVAALQPLLDAIFAAVKQMEPLMGAVRLHAPAISPAPDNLPTGLAEPAQAQVPFDAPVAPEPASESGTAHEPAGAVSEVAPTIPDPTGETGPSESSSDTPADPSGNDGESVPEA